MGKNILKKFEISDSLPRYSGSRLNSYKLNLNKGLFFDNSDASDNYSGKTLDRQKINILSTLLAAGLIILMGRILYLQLWQGKNYLAIAEGNRLRTQYSYAPRGILYDRNRNILVKNIPRFSLSIIPADLPKTESAKTAILQKISETIGLSLAELNSTLDGVPSYYYQPIPIKDNLNYEDAIRLQIAAGESSGVTLINTAIREYLSEAELGQVFGYVGKINADELKKSKNKSYLYNDTIGKSGLELYYENELRGQYGQKEIEVNALGQEKRSIKQKDSEPGHNLVLTIDVELQKIAAKALQDRLTLLGKKRGVVIVQNPNTGEILSMISTPSLDNNLFAKGISQADYQKLLNDPDKPLFFRAIAGEYPSGSTIKPVMAAAALQDGIINDQTSFVSVGGLTLGRFTFPDWKAGGHGVTNVYKAIAESVNTFFYIIGGGYNNFIGLGPDKIAKYETLFGFGQPTGIDLPGEKDGFVPTPSWKEKTLKQPWYIGDTYHISIGQGDFLVTPIQLINGLSSFANGGKLYKPYLVKNILSAEDQLIKEIIPTVIRENFIDQKNIQTVRQGMRQTILAGSARYLQAVKMPIAGKTGTAQIAGKQNLAWFYGFAPFDNPQISVLVMIEEGIEGSSNSVPVAKEIFQWWQDNRLNNPTGNPVNQATSTTH